MRKKTVTGNGLVWVFAKVFKYATLLLLIVLILKWAVLLGENMEGVLVESFPEVSVKTDVMEGSKEKNKQSVSVDFSILYTDIKDEFEQLKKDLNLYKKKQVRELADTMIYQLDREEGYLDWLYGWGTGWKMVGHSIWGWIDEEESANAYISKYFKEMVIDRTSIELYNQKVEIFAKQRIEDFYHSVLKKVEGEIIKKSDKLKSPEDNKVVVNAAVLPWGKYMGQSTIDIGMLAATYVATSSAKGTLASTAAMSAAKASSTAAAKDVAGKAAGAKVGSAISSKVASMVGAKVGSASISLVIDVATLGIGVLVDWLFNEGYEAIYREDDRKKYILLIENIVNQQIIPAYDRYLETLFSNIASELEEELHKQAVIRMVE